MELDNKQLSKLLLVAWSIYVKLLIDYVKV